MHEKAFQPIEKKSLDRFIPMYNVATNLCTKMNDNRFTFILLFDCRQRIKTPTEETEKTAAAQEAHWSLYAVRTFIDADAKRVKDMLDYAYFDIMGCGTTRHSKHTASVKTYIEDYLLKEWHKTMHGGANLNAIHHTDKAGLILPSIYCYLFDSSNYRHEDLLSAYHNTAVLSDLMEERNEFTKRVNNYMKTVDLDQEIAKMDEVSDGEEDDKDNEKDVPTPASLIDPPRGFEARFYVNPAGTHHRREYESTLPEEPDTLPSVRGVNYVQFVKKLDRHHDQKANHADRLAAWLEILHLCDSRLFSHARLQRDFPRSTGLARRLSCALARESMLCTLSIQHFCTRNKINDILRHVLITQNPKLYPKENRYLRNFSSYCEWENYVDIGRVRVLAKQLASSVILLEWLDNSLSSQALKKYSQSELLCELALIPSHDSRSPPSDYDDLTNFNFSYFFTSCRPLDSDCPLPANDFSGRHHNWHTAMRATLQVNERLQITEMHQRTARKNTRLINLSDIIPLDVAINGAKSDEANDAGSQTADSPAASTADPPDIRMRLKAALSSQKNNQGSRHRCTASDVDTWRFIVEDSVYGVPLKTRLSPDDNDHASKANPAVAVIADLTHAALSAMSKIRIISYNQRKPRNTAPVKKWVAYDDMGKNKTLRAQQSFSRLAAALGSAAQGDENNATLPLCVSFTGMNINQPDQSGHVDKQQRHTALSSLSAIIRDFHDISARRGAGKDTDGINIEQLLFLELFLTCSDARHPILINGNPGTGKTTVMMHLIQHLCDLIVCLLPTKVLRERTANTIAAILKKKQPDGNIKMKKNTTPHIMTFSALVKRLMRYSSSPQIYSRIIENHLTSQQQRMCRVIRPAFLNPDFSPTGMPDSTIRYPPIAFIDEYNLIDWHQHFLIGEAFEMLRVARVLYGDSGQSSPIKSSNDNADMISLRCALTVQFVDNKRIIDTGDSLRELLSDQIWNWRSNNENDNVCNYVRGLLHRHLHHLVNHDVVLSGLASWFFAVSRLLDWYDNKPCRRHLRTRSDIRQLLRLVPALPLPCIIGLKNRECDRSNYWIARAVHDYVSQRCQKGDSSAGDPLPLSSSPYRSKQVADNYCIVIRRNAYATAEVYEANTDLITTEYQDSEYQYGMIADDPWCADLTLILGAVYRFIGSSTLLERDSLLQLIAFLPENDKSSPYCCNEASCDSCCHQAVKSQGSRKTTCTLGCGPPGKPSEFELALLADSPDGDEKKNTITRGMATAMPRLLMRRINNTASTTKDNSDNVTDLFIVTRSYYTLTRCNSVWTPPLYTTHNPREGMRLYGYPLVLNASVTSYRVQGETIADTDVYINFDGMAKEQALVALSRIRQFGQLRGVININKFGG